MNKGILKVTSGLLLCSFLAYTTPIFAFSKEETVYTKVKPNGESYKTIVSAHLKNEDKEQVLKDISDLINIENVNGDETFELNGEELTWSANGSDIYYQGESKKELPVKCSIKYELDGKEVKPEELAGKKGKVKITISYENLDEHRVSINGKIVSMYTPFTVITGTIFDNTKCKNVKVSSGKVVNDGTKTIVMGVSMPGMQESLNISAKTFEIPSSIEITMDAENYEQKNIVTFITPKLFEEKVSFSKLNDLYNKVNEIQDASKKIEDGANALKDGTNAAYEGANTIKTEVANSLNSSSGALDDETLNQIRAGAAQGATLSDAQKEAIANQAAQGAALTDAQKAAIANQAAQGAELTDEQKEAIANQAAQGATLSNEQLNAIASQALAGVGTLNVELTDAQIAGIKAQADSAIDNTYSTSIKQGARDQVDDLLSGISSQITTSITAENIIAASGNNVSEAVATAIATNLSAGIANNLENSKTQIYAQAEATAIASAKQIAENSAVTAAQAAAQSAAQTAAEQTAQATAKSVAQSTATQTASKTATAVAQSTATQTASKTATAVAQSTATQTASKTATTVAQSVATSVATETAVKTATAVASEAQEKVAQKMVALNNGLGQLTDGLKQLSDGTIELADGISEFNTKAIDKIVGYINGNVKDLAKRAEKLQELSEEYANFTKAQDGTAKEVKFILITDGIKVKEEKEEN